MRGKERRKGVKKNVERNTCKLWRGSGRGEGEEKERERERREREGGERERNGLAWYSIKKLASKQAKEQSNK